MENLPDSRYFIDYQTEKLRTECDAVACMQVSRNLQDDYAFRVVEGRLFEEKDFHVTSDKKIPVLIGNKYSGLYRIGDEFTGDYLFDTYTFQVIGILDKEMYIANSEIIAELDHYIVMPSFCITDEDMFTDGIQIHYANKVSGLLRVDRENEHVFKKKIQPLLESGMAGKFSWQVSPVEIAFRNVFKMDIMTSMTILIVLIITSAVLYLYCLLRFLKAVIVYR